MIFINIHKFIKKLGFLDIIIILSILFMSLITLHFFTQEEQWVSILVAEEEPISLYQTQSISKGNYQIDSHGQKIAIVKSSNTFIPEGKNPFSLIMRVDVKTKINQRTKENEFENKPLQIGSPIQLKLNTGSFNGVIISTNLQDKDIIYKTVNLYLKQKDEEFLNSLTKNTQTNEEESINILKTKIIEEESRLSSIKDENSNKNFDLILTIKVPTTTIKNIPFYGYQVPIVVGNNFSFILNQALVNDALIISVE